jgi:hypothetical protein
LIGSAIVRNMVRDVDEAEKLSREAMRWANEHRLKQWLAFAQAYLGFALCLKGDQETGINLQERGMRSLHAAGSMLMTTRLRMNLAESLVGIGELEKARVHLSAGQSYRATYGEEAQAAELDRLEAESLRAEGAPTQIVELHLCNALRIAQRQGARFF